MTFLRQIGRADGHKHMAIDTDGSEILVWCNSNDPAPLAGTRNAVVKIRLSDGLETGLLNLDWSLAYHLSAPDNEGYVYADVFAPSPSTTGSGTLYTFLWNDPSVAFINGTDGQPWFTVTNSATLGGTAVQAIDPGCQCVFTFTGTGVYWLGWRDEYSGIATVSIDGGPAVTFDTYSATQEAQYQALLASGLPLGVHTVTITALGTKNSASLSAWVWVNGFFTFTSVAVPIPPTNWFVYTNELVRINLDGSGVLRIAHHRSRVGVTNAYNYQPRVSSSRDGSRIVFASDFDLTAISGNPDQYVDTYLVRLIATGTVVAPPVFSPTAGAYSSAQFVSISTITPGATIRYTLDGSTPSGSVGTVYTGSIIISSTTTLKAIAYMAGWTNSSVTAATYTISEPDVSTPTFSLPSGASMPPPLSYYTALPTSQWRLAPKFNAWLAANLQLFQDVIICAESFQAAFTPGIASGPQLDVLGNIVGCSRTVNFQPSDSVSPVLDDQTFTLLILATIMKNHWDGQLDSLIAIWNALFPGGGLTVVDHQNMTVDLYASGPANSIQQDLVTHGYLLPRPQAVEYIYHWAALPMLGFDANTAYEAGFDTGFFT
jgi:hypothetical protein